MGSKCVTYSQVRPMSERGAGGEANVGKFLGLRFVCDECVTTTQCK